jgi:hypothetical protein
LHNGKKELIRSYKTRRWITCVLLFRDRHRTVMSENRYTELFFLDEAVAFAAGHRPCAECQRDRFNAFRNAWQRAYQLDHLPFADEMDLVLHPARIEKSRMKVTYQAALASLPNGCFIQLGCSPYLVWENSLSLWTPAGYCAPEPRPEHQFVTVLTPEPFVRCFLAGYLPEIHNSRARKP